MRLVHSCRGPFWVWDQDHLGQQLEAQTWWDQHLQPAIDAVAALHPEGTAIDLGANVGWFTTYFAEKFSHVLAVEADLGTYALLIRNIHERQVTNVLCCAYAAWDQRELLDRVTGAMIGWPIPDDLNLTPNASSLAFQPKQWGSVPGMPIDDVIGDTANVVLIKCDVQGADLRALKGLTKTIQRCRPTILMEFEEAASSWHGDAWVDYLEWFDQMGYDVSWIWATDYLAVPR